MSYTAILYGPYRIYHGLHIFATSDKGINSATARHIIIYVVSMPSEYDESNIWPVSGKQFTVGIVEPGFFIYLNISWIYLSSIPVFFMLYKNHLKPNKSLKDQIRFRRSSSDNHLWKNPTIEGAQQHGFVDFIHDFLFFNNSLPNEWDFVFENSMKFSFR